MRIRRSLCCVAAAVSLTPVASLAVEYPPKAGTDRQSEAYLDATERYLEALDLDDPTLTLERLGGTTATNWAVAQDGRVVADLKCTSGNTNHHGAVVAYRLGRELGFNIYPVAVYRNVNRRIDGATINQQCALKEWESIYTQYYWTRETFTSSDSRDKSRLVRALSCDNPKPLESDEFTFSARSAYGDPKPPGAGRVPYRGSTSLLAASRDFSNMMVVDTLIGNEDRFPGGNMFFRSVTTTFAERDGGIVFDHARFYSLDNEAAFKGRGPSSTHSARDLKQHVWRFDADMIAGLQRLAGDSEALERVTSGDAHMAGFILDGVQIVLDQYAAAQKRCGAEAATF